MKIVSFTLENFRGYKESTTITFNDLTVLIGKNDIGKSTILEGLDIFFENRKLDSDDVNIEAKKNKETVKLTAIFSNLPDEINLDAGAKTNLKDEFLLNSEFLLEIKKDFSALTKPKTFIVCNHPTNEDANDLHSLKIKDLQTRIKKLNIDGDFKASIKNEIRKAIWDSLGETLYLDKTDLEISEEGVKDIWDKISPELPLFALFQSDRKNDDKDKEIQDPLKIAAEQAFKKHLPILNEIKKEVEREVGEIANLTIEKLKEMNEEVADKLSLQYPSELKWHNLFSPTLTSDDVPMNKRGSGVRRLLLINFFRAEAERRRKEKNTPNVIYAIEEPETSQHPDWQLKLIDALKELAENGSSQIITTTHSPSLGSIIPVENLRFIHKINGKNKIETGNEDNLETIAKTLGVLPSLEKEPEHVKVFLCLEGPTDIEFFNKIAPLFGIDLINDNRIVAISLGGGTLGHWVTNNYLKKLNKQEVHIYDRDEDLKYQNFVDEVNNRGLGHYAVLTQKREIENYFHESIIIPSFQANDGFPIILTIDDHSDITTIIAKLRHGQRSPGKVWENQGKNYRDRCTSHVKKHLNTITSSQITIDLLKQRNAHEEVSQWFEEIKKRLN
ncbi:ATP-binding protein [Flavobacterium sp. MMLR14_040]|uniref:ATP-binding protein n=1 Tax=Flavobacterium sp. MMLR14_040 TaxID=3093843 RepID=UPI00298FF23D|nr:ATP-binding protein [Flavobacterium sp. MMLR14_040]MDW8852856.1 ATP-binding protein [Flavobacterium sp. MMLR14_040]